MRCLFCPFRIQLSHLTRPSSTAASRPCQTRAGACCEKPEPGAAELPALVSHETSRLLRPPRAASGSAAALSALSPAAQGAPLSPAARMSVQFGPCGQELAAAHSTSPPRLPPRKTLFYEGLKGGIEGGGECRLPWRARHAGRSPAALASHSRLPPTNPRSPIGPGLASLRLPSPIPASRLQPGKHAGVGFQLPGGGLQARSSVPSSEDATRRSLDPGRLGAPSGCNARVGGTWTGRGLAAGGASHMLPRLRLRGKVSSGV